MPVHDWKQVPGGVFHDFHQSWTIRIKDRLNGGLLPKEIVAMVELRSGPREADVLGIETSRRKAIDGGGVSTLPKPSAPIIQRTSMQFYAAKANRIVLKHGLGRTVAVIEVVSPGNKDSRASFCEFVAKSIEYLQAGVHLLVVDLFPPTSRDPKGIHKAIWAELSEEDFAFPVGKDRTLVSYDAGTEQVAYVKPIAVGDVLPDMPLYLWPDLYVMVPLEPTYQATWDVAPEPVKRFVETGVLQDLDAE